MAKKQLKKITSVDQLPDWFFNRQYGKNLSDIEWYRQIRVRQKLNQMVEMQKHLRAKEERLNKSDCLDERDYEARTRKLILEMLEEDEIELDPHVYYLHQDGNPISDLIVKETIYLAFALRNENLSEVTEEYNQLLISWCDALKEMEGREGDIIPYPASYEERLRSFLFETENENIDKMQELIINHSETLRNPFLSYDRPLNGYPVTIDTQFDDKTIIEHIKEWLVETRKWEESKARRPFNQNDFDDWKLYKIREIWDLESWARVKGSKILDRVIADALWPTPPDDFSPIDVLRTTARKKAKEIFQFETVRRLYSQLLLQHGENFLEQ